MPEGGDIGQAAADRQRRARWLDRTLERHGGDADAALADAERLELFIESGMDVGAPRMRALPAPSREAAAEPALEPEPEPDRPARWPVGDQAAALGLEPAATDGGPGWVLAGAAPAEDAAALGWDAEAGFSEDHDRAGDDEGDDAEPVALPGTTSPAQAAALGARQLADQKAAAEKWQEPAPPPDQDPGQAARPRDKPGPKSGASPEARAAFAAAERILAAGGRLSARVLAERLGVSEEAAGRQLRGLVHRGQIRRQGVTHRTRYWLPGQEDPGPPPGPAARTGGGEDGDSDPGSGSGAGVKAGRPADPCPARDRPSPAVATVAEVAEAARPAGGPPAPGPEPEAVPAPGAGRAVAAVSTPDKEALRTDPERRAAIERHIAEKGVIRVEPGPGDADREWIVDWVRGQGPTVEPLEDGRFKVNGRAMGARDFLDFANLRRDRDGAPRFTRAELARPKLDGPRLCDRLLREAERVGLSVVAAHRGGFLVEGRATVDGAGLLARINTRRQRRRQHPLREELL